LAWLEQVFNRCTKEKARRSYRLLIVDGHSSHITQDFIEYCDDHRILLMVFPPHATHSLQPLDVVLFAPLSTAYSTELLILLQQSQGLTPIKKVDFFPLFWAAYKSSFTSQNICKAFEATGIEPRNADVVLQRFKILTLQQFKDLEIEELGNGSSWKDLRNLLQVAVLDKLKVKAKQLSTALHLL
jgi:hypothetical protein